MSRAGLAALAMTVGLCGCPERATPQRGVALTFKKLDDADDVRRVVDRRLAQLSIKATLHEDAHTLTVRVPEGADVSSIKPLLLRRASLGFCAVDEATTERWCAHPAPPDAALAQPVAGCTAVGPLNPAQVAALAAALAKEAPGGVRRATTPDAGASPSVSVGQFDAGVRVVLEKKRATPVAWPVDGRCLEPTILAATATATAQGPAHALQLQFDRRGTADFAALTGRLVGKRLLIVLDDEVLAAPLVESAITAGKAMLMVDDSESSARLLAAALAGGPLPALELISEKPYGPPSLR